ncbi:MAG: methylenetetrahydrofolate reductase [Solirubrobacteraceae bacterium]|jgi:methylenetetrahydrofolate reductase (NADPH)|nr:methylenetetrahydrofolate reductase [Solirubrobacteraceae bacterium]
MRLRDIYSRPGHTFSIEFWPPKTPAGEAELFREIEVLRTLEPAFCSMTYGAGGSTREKTVDLVARIHREYELEVMCHLTVVGQPKAVVRSVLDRLKVESIENIIALAGDPPDGAEADWNPHPEGFAHSRALVEEAIGRGFSVAVAGFPEIHPRAGSREADLGYLREKVAAGADVVITQLFFENDDYHRYVEEARRLGVDVPIVPGLLPIRSAAQIRRFTALCGSRIPARLADRLEKVGDDEEAAIQLGIDYATEQAEDLLAAGAPGIHFYSLNRSRSVMAIFGNLSLPLST